MESTIEYTQDQPARKRLLPPIVLTATAVILGVKSTDGDSEAFLWFLFLFPFIPQGVALITLYKHHNIIFYRFYVLTTFSSLIGYCGLWYIYSTSWKDLEVFSWIALVLIGGLTALVLYLTKAMIMKPLTKNGGSNQDRNGGSAFLNLQSLREGVESDPFLALILFITVFLGISYLFGFALAFHDQHSRKISDGKAPALYAINLPSVDDSGFVAEHERKKPDQNSATTQAQVPGPATSSTSPHQQFHFYFPPLGARLKTTSSVADPPQALPAINDSRYKPEECNYLHLDAMVREIQKNTNKGIHVFVLLIGHADNEPIDLTNTPYRSNYELSEARAENVKYEVMHRLSFDRNNQDGNQDLNRWHDVEWVTLPLSNEPFPPELANNLSRDKNRIVLALVKPVPDHITTLQMRQGESKILNLMDYMYFSIYTITTTGYGDIIPTTAYAKFLTSLANICEIVFLVIFFNALMSSYKGLSINV